MYEDLDAEVASMALEVDPRGFVGLLSGLCLLARDRLGEPTARRVAGMCDHEDLREALAGVERILPVLCRPYPEWISNEDRRLWLRPPARGARGVPRILAPLELKEFLESTTDKEIAGLPGGYVVNLSDQRHVGEGDPVCGARRTGLLLGAHYILGEF